MISLNEDYQLFRYFVSLSEVENLNPNQSNITQNNPNQLINHTENVKKMENAKNILKEKMKYATPQGKEYLQRQHDLVDKQHSNAIQNEQADKMNRRALIKQIHNEAVNNMIKDEQARKSKYDENNKEHKAIIQQYHNQKMEKARAAKNLNKSNIKNANNTINQNVKINRIQNQPVNQSAKSSNVSKFKEEVISELNISESIMNILSKKQKCLLEVEITKYDNKTDLISERIDKIKSTNRLIKVDD